MNRSSRDLTLSTDGGHPMWITLEREPEGGVAVSDGSIYGPCGTGRGEISLDRGSTRYIRGAPAVPPRERLLVVHDDEGRVWAVRWAGGVAVTSL